MYQLMTLENSYYQIKPGRKKKTRRDYLIVCIHCQNNYHFRVVLSMFKFNNGIGMYC